MSLRRHRLTPMTQTSSASATPGAGPLWAPVRRPSPQERALVEEIARLDVKAVWVERLSATIDSNYGQTVEAALSPDEIGQFTSHWSQEVLDLCLRSGATAIELRGALRTGELPDHGLVTALAAFRAALPGPAQPSAPSAP